MASNALVSDAPASVRPADGDLSLHAPFRPGAATRRAILGLLAAGAILAVAGWAALTLYAGRGAGGSERGAITLDRDGYRYVFHPVTGDEALFDLREDPRQLRNLIRERWDQVLRMRRALEKERGVESLDALRAPEEETIRSLRALGYL